LSPFNSPRAAPTPVVPSRVVGELHASFLSAHRSARRQLRAIQRVERQHGAAPLTVLADLAVRGVLAPELDLPEQVQP
jgi:hypothetical protein